MRGPLDKPFLLALAENPGIPYIEPNGEMLYVQAPGCVVFCHASVGENFNRMSDEHLIRISRILMQKIAERN
jgi:hypothetical protein